MDVLAQTITAHRAPKRFSRICVSKNEAIHSATRWRRRRCTAWSVFLRHIDGLMRVTINMTVSWDLDEIWYSLLPVDEAKVAI